MINYINKLLQKYNDKKYYKRLNNEYHFRTNKKMYVVASISAKTDILDDYDDIIYTINHTYILKENGEGSRDVNIMTSGKTSYDKQTALRHVTYLNYVGPWKNGLDFAHIPRASDIMHNTKEPFKNY